MVIDIHTQVRKGPNFFNTEALSSVVIEIEFNFFKRWLLPMLKNLFVLIFRVSLLDMSHLLTLSR